MVSDDFNNVSSFDDIKQKNAQDDLDRQRKIENIPDPKKQRIAQTMTNQRDERLREQKDKNDQKEQEAVDELVKKIKPDHQLNLNPPGMPPESYSDRVLAAKKTVRQTVGPELDKKLEDINAKENRAIDKFIDRSLSQSQKKDQFQKNDMSFSKPVNVGESGVTETFDKVRGRSYKR